jgi:hypothetical protein
LKPAWANSSGAHILKKFPSQKNAGGVAHDVGTEIKPQKHTKKRKPSMFICFITIYQ